MRAAAEAKSITLQAIIDPGVGLLPGDSGRLQQVVWNLLSNAVKFTPREGKIQVSFCLTSCSTVLIQFSVKSLI